VTGRQHGRRRRKLLDDLKERRGYSHLKEEALDRTMWRARFGRGFGPVVRQTTKWMNISPSLQSTTRVTRLLKCQLIEPQNHLCILNHSLIHDVVMTSERWWSSFSQVFHYGLQEHDFIRSCQRFSPGGKMVAAWSWRTHSSSTRRKDALKFKSILLNVFVAQNRDRLTCTCPTVQ